MMNDSRESGGVYLLKFGVYFRIYPFDELTFPLFLYFIQSYHQYVWKVN